MLCEWVIKSSKFMFSENAIRAAKALALTAADVMSEPSTLEVMKAEYIPYKSSSGRMLLKHRSVSTDLHH